MQRTPKAFARHGGQAGQGRWPLRVLAFNDFHIQPAPTRALDAADAPCVFTALGALSGVTFTVETEQETDGRWMAEIAQIPGAMSYGSTRDEAVARVEALGLRVLAERIEQGESSPEIQQVFTVAAA